MFFVKQKGKNISLNFKNVSNNSKIIYCVTNLNDNESVNFCSKSLRENLSQEQINTGPILQTFP